MASVRSLATFFCHPPIFAVGLHLDKPFKTAVGSAASLLLVLVPPMAPAAWDCRAGDAGQWVCQESAGPRISRATAPPQTARTPVADGVAAGVAAISATSPPPSVEPSADARQAAEPAVDVSAGDASIEAGRPRETAEGAVSEAPAVPKVAAPAQPSIAQRLRSDDIHAGLEWRYCGMPEPAAAEQHAIRSDNPEEPLVITGEMFEIRADAADLDLAKRRLSVEGDVEFQFGARQLFADRVDYDHLSGEVRASGDVRIDDPLARLVGERATWQLSDDSARVEQAEYRLVNINARGSADQVEFDGDRVGQLSGLTFTTCPPGQDDWLLSAETLVLERDTGLATAEDAKLEFFDVPIAYVPTFTFPYDGRRLSGFLMPTAAVTGNTGFDLRVPYYFNLAPNYDLTLVPRITSKRGLMLGGEFRHLSETNKSVLNGEILPDDQERPGGGTRGAFSFRDKGRYTDNWFSAVRVAYASDDDYLEDLGNDLATTSSRQLERAAEVHYDERYWHVLGRVQQYQTLDKQIPLADRPYSRLPQVRLDLRRPEGVQGLTYHLDSEYSHFDRDNSVVGHRWDLQPGLSLPVRRDWGYVEPKASARYTGYRLTNVAAGQDDNPDRLLGTFSLDSGLFYDRDTTWLNGQGVTQTLEPRLFYLYVPRTDQNGLPVFDSREQDFSFDSLFLENRYSGADRVGDANQVTLAVTSRALADTSGRELARFSLGQVYHFSDRTVTLPGMPIDTDGSSSVVAEAAALLTDHWRVTGNIEVDPERSSHIDQGGVRFNYRDGDDRLIHLAYRYRDGLLEQTDLAGYWPLSASTRLIGRWNYSLRDNRNLESVLGVEYGKCCWRVRALARQFVDSDQGDQNLAVMLQLELAGLGQLGQDIDGYLERGLYGYDADQD